MEQNAINALRVLGIDAINKAKSGHPGMVLGAAPMAYTLWTKHLNITNKESNWFNRDRFILSAGHGSMLLYGLLHFSGYDISIEDIKQFRQWGSKTPGHPEFGHTHGVDATTGPLGQGISMGVGMALAESYLSHKFNVKNYNIVDHYTYVLCGDGDLQEGVAAEAISFAGHNKLDKLVVLYDSNDIQLDGDVSMANSESTKQKFEAMNWNYILVEDGNNVEEINNAIEKAKEENNKPTIIEIKTVIGYGSPLAGQSASHGAPLGDEHGNAAKTYYNWEQDSFDINEDVYKHYEENVSNRGFEAYNKWQELFNQYKETHPELGNELDKFINDNAEINFDEVLPKFEVGYSEATRKTSGKIIENLSSHLGNLIGGSADLTKSTFAKGADGNYPEGGRNINYGVREHAMGAIANGIMLHGGLKTFTGAFFVFSDYMKPAIRMAALMNLSTTFVFTHDSVAVGEDGPTHQPIEHLAMVRTIPNTVVFRPCDANETNAAWRHAIESNDHPTVLALSRQNLTTLKETKYEDIVKGGYVISEASSDIDGILIASGSEVELAINTQAKLAEENIHVRVVSMPSIELFEKQSKEYQDAVLPKHVTKRLALEMAHPMCWYKYSQNVMGITTFGTSAPGNTVIEKYGFTVDNVYNHYKNL